MWEKLRVSIGPPGTNTLRETEDTTKSPAIQYLLAVFMGANIRIKGQNAIIQGVPFLSGAPVMATDLRASAALVLAGLAAEGMTIVKGLHHLDRGYDNLEGKLRKLGAKLERIQVSPEDLDKENSPASQELSPANP